MIDIVFDRPLVEAEDCFVEAIQNGRVLSGGWVRKGAYWVLRLEEETDRELKYALEKISEQEKEIERLRDELEAWENPGRAKLPQRSA